MDHTTRDELGRWALLSALLLTTACLSSCGERRSASEPPPAAPTWCDAVDGWVSSLPSDGPPFACPSAPGLPRTGDFGVTSLVSSGRLAECAPAESWRATNPTASSSFRFEARAAVGAGGAVSLPLRGGRFRLSGSVEGTSEVRFVVTLEEAVTVQVQNLEQAIGTRVPADCGALCSPTGQLVTEAIQARLVVDAFRADGREWEAGVTIGQEADHEPDVVDLPFEAQAATGNRASLRLVSKRVVTVAYRAVPSRSRLSSACSATSSSEFSITWQPQADEGIWPETEQAHLMPAPPNASPGDPVHVHFVLVEMSMIPSQPSERCQGTNEDARLIAEMGLDVQGYTNSMSCESEDNTGCRDDRTLTVQGIVDASGHIPIALQTGQCACVDCACGAPQSCRGVVRVSATVRD